MNSSLFQILKVASAVPPAALPNAGGGVPPASLPNAVSGPVVSVIAGGRGSSAPRVAASAPTGDSSNFSANPLIAAPTALGAMVSHNGNYIPASQAQQMQQQEMIEQAEAQKNAPKEKEPVSDDTPLSGHLMASWTSRLKAASDNVFLPKINQPYGSTLGIPAFDSYTSPSSSYNPFDSKKNPTLAGIYSDVARVIKAPLYKRRQAQAFAGELAKRPDLAYNQFLARRVSDTATTGSSMNPLLAFGVNLLGSALGEGGIGQAFNQIKSEIK